MVPNARPPASGRRSVMSKRVAGMTNLRRALYGIRARGSLSAVYLDRRLLAFTRGVRGRITAAVVLGLLQVIAGIARLALLGWLLARVFAGATLPDLLLPVALVAVAVVVRGALEYWRIAMAHRTAGVVQARLRQTIYDHVVALGPAHVAGTRTGEVIVSMVAGVQQLEV